MSESREKDIIFIVVEVDVLACADELGIPRKWVNDDVIESMKRRINLEFGNCLEVVKSALKESIECPLGLVCYPYCFWWRDRTGNAASQESIK